MKFICRGDFRENPDDKKTVGLRQRIDSNEDQKRKEEEANVTSTFCAKRLGNLRRHSKTTSKVIVPKTLEDFSHR